MDDYSKEKWSADFPDRAGQEVRPTEAVENTLDYDVLFPHTEKLVVSYKYQHY